MQIIITPDFTEGNYSVGNLLERIEVLTKVISDLEFQLRDAYNDIENYKKLTNALQNKINMLIAEKREYNQFAYSPH